MTSNVFILVFIFATIAVDNTVAGGDQQASSRYLHINEVVSSNATTLFDEDGDTPDWIELYNSGDKPLSLNGYGLSDDYNDPFRWVFPDVSIDPGGFLLIMASGKDRRDPDQPLHTDFRIASEGEKILLTNYSGERADSLPSTRIPTDISLGRQPDGTGDWFFFREPTPGAPNTGEAHLGKLEKPRFSHEPGCYDQGFPLALNHPENGVAIYYTLDGSQPGSDSKEFTGERLDIQDRSHEPNVLSAIPTSSSTYWMPPEHPVKKATVVRSVAVKPGYINSRVQTGTFLVDTDCRERYSLPVVSLVADPDHFFDDEIGIYVHGESARANYWQMGREWERPVHIELFDEDGNQIFRQDAGVRLHGGATRIYGQKSLRLYARNEYGDSRFRFPFFSDQPESEFNTISDPAFTEFNRLILRNSGNDWQNTMFRDAFAQNLVRHLNMDTQGYRPSVVFLNGEYWGIHNFRERYDRHYLARVYGVDPDRIDLLTLNMQVKEGDNEHYRQVMDFLTENDMGDASNLKKVEEMIDMDNFLDYYSSQVYFANRDWPQNNIDYWRLRVPYDSTAARGHDGRWRWLMYDVDYAFGLVNDHSFDMLNWVMKDHWSTAVFWNLIDSDAFRNGFINRMADLLNTAFHPAHVLMLLESMAERVEPEIPEHFDRWGRPGSWAGSDWAENVNRMRDFARYRPESVRDHIMSHFELDGLAELSVDVSDPDAGHVVVNDIKIDPSTPGIDMMMPDSDHAEQGDLSSWYPWTGVYFQDVPVTVRAVAHPGYCFSHWEGIEEGYPDEEGYPALETHHSVGGYRIGAGYQAGAGYRARGGYQSGGGYRAGGDYQSGDDYQSGGDYQSGDDYQAGGAYSGDDVHPDIDIFDRTITLPMNKAASVTAVFKVDTGVTEESDRQRPGEFKLYQNYPNPFNQSTVIRYQVPTDGDVRLEVYDVVGRRVAVLVDGAVNEGSRQVVLDAAGMSSGIYIYRLEAGGKTISRSMAIIR